MCIAVSMVNIEIRPEKIGIDEAYKYITNTVHVPFGRVFLELEVIKCSFTELLQKCGVLLEIITELIHKFMTNVIS